jgi:hypothetical protein
MAALLKNSYQILRRQYFKADAVVNSCVNPLHVDVAKRYVELWMKRLELMKKEIHIEEYERLMVLSKYRLRDKLNQIGEYDEQL